MLTSNAIVIENQLVGTPKSVWQIKDNIPSTNIEGFATDISFNVGETASFKINTVSQNYQLEIYRLGYYNGDGARLVATIESEGSANQPAPLTNPATGLVDAGNWIVTDTWSIPPDAVSGVYFAKLNRQDGVHGQNMVPFIVRNDGAPSDITFQTSDTTWTAYNSWGGSSLYSGGVAVSYNRPLVDPTGLASVFSADHALISYLEQNGFDVTYISGVDTARDGAQLLDHKLFISAGHDEYWSAGQRTNVELAREAGVNLAFFGGNDVYWKTRWETSIDSFGTPYRTLVCYKETPANAKIDPSAEWTGTWADPRFSPPSDGGRPQNELTGTIFTANGTSVDQYIDAQINIPSAMAGLRFWRNTAIADVLPGQTGTLKPGSLGYEWNSDLDNGFRPEGLINLSSTTLHTETLLLDYGSTYGPGTATHALTLYRDHSSGALVFSAGSVFFSWALSPDHATLGLPTVATDANAQQAIINLLADMGIQPASLAEFLVQQSASTDHVAPLSLISQLAGNHVEGDVVLVQGAASDAGGHVASVEVSTDGGQSWHRAIGLDNWSYGFNADAPQTYSILSRAVDDSLNIQKSKNEMLIAVSGGLLAETATPAHAVNESNGVELGLKFTVSEDGLVTGVQYYKSALDTGPHTGTLWSETGIELATVDFVNETASGWQTAKFSTPVTVLAGSTYLASYHSNGNFSHSFDYFDSPIANGALRTDVGASQYAYGSGSIFPTQSYANSNYWVDVEFTPTPVATVSLFQEDDTPDFAANDPNSVELGVEFTVSQDGLIIGVQYYKSALDLGPHTGSLWTEGGTLLATVDFQNESSSGWQTAKFSAPVAVQEGATYLASYHSNGYFSDTFDFFDTPHTDGGLTALVGASAYAYGTETIFPVNNYANSNYWVDVLFKPLSDVDGGLFSSAATPDFVANDPRSVELGMKFTGTEDGFITALQYYKSELDNGPHTGSIWNDAGVLLAQVNFANETASGWQTASLSDPLAITAHSSYVASYHSNGFFSDTFGYFETPHTSGVLTAPTGASVYAYGNESLFPTESYDNSNYWVDVVFATSVRTA